MKLGTIELTEQSTARSDKRETSDTDTQRDIDTWLGVTVVRTHDILILVYDKVFSLNYGNAVSTPA
jgi:hypothetical protein